MAGKIFYYLALPADVVPGALFDLKAKAVRVSVVFQTAEGHIYRIAADAREEVKLASMDVPIEDLKVHVADLVAECRGVRSEIVPMAIHLGMADDIPVPGNSKTWSSLVKKIHDGMHGLPGPRIVVSESDSGPEEGN